MPVSATGYHVMQARAVVSVTDIHAGALADSVQALENLDGICAVFVRRLGVVCHEFTLRFSVDFIRQSQGVVTRLTQDLAVREFGVPTVCQGTAPGKTDVPWSVSVTS